MPLSEEQWYPIWKAGDPWCVSSVKTTAEELRGIAEARPGAYRYCESTQALYGRVPDCIPSDRDDVREQIERTVARYNELRKQQEPG